MFRRFVQSALLATLLTSSALAQIVQYSAQGTITSAAPGLDPELWDPVQVGAVFTVTFRVDTGTTPSFDDGTRVIYTEPILEVEIDIGGIVASLDSLVNTSVQVTDDRTIGIGCVDDFELLVTANSFEVDMINVLLGANETLPGCPATSLNGTGYPNAIEVTGFTSTSRFELLTTSFGVFEGVVNSIVVIRPEEDFCSGDGGDQLGCTDCPCGNNAAAGTIGGCLNSVASSGRLTVSGSYSTSLPPGSSNDARFALSGVPPTAFCLLNSGDALAPTSAANPCFGLSSGSQAAQFDGLRCAVQNTLRHGGRSADSNGDVGVTNNPWGGEGGPPAGIAVAGAGFSAGQTRYFQVIHRDDPLAVCGRGLNTSQAVEVSFTP